ncbi:MAG: hypothetical protein LBS31_04105, partial [Candidatus Adiutrix sp.]|nr:hypothetical protein [Candidatus Adiutrix sp.]
MPHRRRRPAAGPGSFLGLAALCLAALAGCGVKTAPYPVDATLPGPVVNLSQNITPEGELILSWLAPQVNRV